MGRLLRRSIPPLATLIAPAAMGAGDGVSPYGYTLFEFLEVPVTNALLTSVFFAALLVYVVRKVVGSATLVPSRGQSIVETFVMGIVATMEPIVGKHLVRKVFPFIAALFFYILINNWSGLLPGVGAFGHVEDGSLKYWFRPANTDINNTIALALMAMAVWGLFVVKHAGIGHFLEHTFGNKADKNETPKPLFLFLTVVFLVVGLIELFSIGIRPFTLSARLFGNIFGGENMLESVYQLVGPGGYWLAAIPFYFLEILVGFVQALVFSLLVTVYIGLACNTDEEH